MKPASASLVFASWQMTGDPEGRVGVRSFFTRKTFLSMREFATASISGVER